MNDYYFSPEYIDTHVARSKSARGAVVADPEQDVIDFEDALSALCKHLDVILMQDVRKRWIVVPAQGLGVFVHGR